MQSDKDKINELLTKTADIWLVVDELNAEPQIVADIAEKLIDEAEDDTDCYRDVCLFISSCKRSTLSTLFSVRAIRRYVRFMLIGTRLITSFYTTKSTYEFFYVSHLILQFVT